MGNPHRTYTPEFKVRVVMELITGKKNLGEASREYGIKDSVISRWRQEFMERAPQIFEQPGSQDAQAERIAELERTLGRLTMQLEMAHLPWRAVPGKKSSGIRTFCSRTADDGAHTCGKTWLCRASSL
jgi:transposase-like protein